MREFYEFCKVATPVFQEYKLAPASIKQPDFGSVLGAMKQARKPVDVDAVMDKAYQNAKAVSLNQAVSNPKSKMGKRLAQNNTLYNDEIKSRIESARANLAARSKLSIKTARRMVPFPVRAAQAAGESIKNHKVQAGLAGATLLGTGAVVAKKMYDKKKAQQAQQQEQTVYNQPTYPQPAYQPAAPYPSQQTMQPTTY